MLEETVLFELLLVPNADFLLNLNQHAINSVAYEEIKLRRQHAVSSLLPMIYMIHTVKLYIFIMPARCRTNDGHALGGYDEWLQNQCSSHNAPALKDISAE